MAFKAILATFSLRMRRNDYLHIWNPRPLFAYSLCNFHGATMTIKGRSNSAALPLDRFQASISKSRRNGAQKWRFWGRGLNVKLWFRNPQKAHPCAEPRRLTSVSYTHLTLPTNREV